MNYWSGAETTEKPWKKGLFSDDVKEAGEPVRENRVNVMIPFLLILRAWDRENGFSFQNGKPIFERENERK